MKLQQINKICITLLSAFCLNVNAQENKQSAFAFNYNYQIPIGGLENTFGHNSAIGAYYLIENNNNIIFGIEANYLFGNDIKDASIFDNISTSSGAIIGADGKYANINPLQRGFDTYLFAGYAFHHTTKNLSGVYISQGVGYLQHQIFIDTKNQNVPQLSEDMKKGYDLFSNGISTKIAIDYKYYHKKGRLQISCGLNYTFAYTKNQRAYNFSKNEFYSRKRVLDQLLGFKFDIIIPIQRKNNEEFYYF